MAKKYTLLRDHRPKAEMVERELPSGEILSFKSAFDYQDGELWDAIGTLQSSEQDMRRLPTAMRKMSVDPDHNFSAIKNEDGFVDADLLNILRDVGEEVFGQLGTLGE